MKNDGGHAFPVLARNVIGDLEPLRLDGMSRRFYLAAAAMQAIIAEGRTPDDKTPTRAFRMADAMLSEEDK